MISDVISFRPSPEQHLKLMAECDLLGITITEVMIRKLASLEMLQTQMQGVKDSLFDLIGWIDEKENAPLLVTYRIKRIANSIHLPKSLSNE